MTAIVPARFKTKKAFKLALLAGEEISLRDPTPWGEDTITFNQPASTLSSAGHFLQGVKMQPGSAVYCTNHPKRSWFAEIIIQPNGTLRVR
jgi:hypothetical protein